MNVEPTSILCFRNGSIGNTLVAVPAVRALRTSFPKAKLVVVVDPMGYELLRYCPWIDDLIEYDKRGDDRSLIAHWRLIRRLRKLHPSHAVLFKRFFRNGLLSILSGAPIRAGFATDGSAPFLNVTIPYDENVHHVDMNLRLVERIGAHPAGRELELCLSEDDLRQADEIVRKCVPLGGNYLCAHYGGSTWFSEKSISVERFAELLRRISQGRTVLLIGSGANETTWANAIASRDSCAIPCCNLPVRTAAGLIRGAELFVGFNSGPSHLAAAVKTPLIMLFEPNEHTRAQIVRWLPQFEHAVAAVPPTGDEMSAWEVLFQEMKALADRLGRNHDRVKA